MSERPVLGSVSSGNSVNVSTTSPKTGYDNYGLYVAIFALLAALMGGSVLLVTGRKKEEE